MQAARVEAVRAMREAEEARAAAQRAAETQQYEARERENQLRDEARRAAEAAQQELQKQQAIAAEEQRKAAEAQRAAEAAAKTAAEEASRAFAAKEEAERQLREGIQPVVMPSAADLEEAKRRIGYQEGYFHFAVTGIAGSGKSSLINAFRGLRNRDAEAAATGITETTLQMARFPDANPANHVVWFDIPGAGTLKVRDWQYFNDQGLYVFDALVVLVDNRFTATDVAILRNARLFNIPCYIVRSKADTHIRNVMIDMGYDSQDDEEDERSRAKLEATAREHFVSATRQNVRDNLRKADLPDQRVYILSNSTMLSVIKNTASSKMSKKLLDEKVFLKDFMANAHGHGEGMMA
ncbi:hypothetical protein CONPUDRAFT_85770 [Coniophora puteana RWD-64-598 SS2]|uniref:IRG-type G domain-containing protein n=1 Tax=Coniophora puteana (strain RWD-64-598) TaxID=741705 RepID=R7SFT9_CONPW|nr:uncharacterized protein CONPUDRAFT_85770 [Coniophora puteana RWD-64-598 SS2]EIW74607.1 hypothetical protein CONPUDRAFT_85770 [Coniophora puteana RWD-64-598 SS2]